MSRNEIKKNASAKEVKSHLASLEGEIEAEELILQKRLQELENKKKIKKSLQKKAKKLDCPNELQCSEHALVKFFFRVKGYNQEEIEKEIKSEKIKEMMKVVGNSGTFPHENGYSLVIKNNKIVTIIK